MLYIPFKSYGNQIGGDPVPTTKVAQAIQSVPVAQQQVTRLSKWQRLNEAVDRIVDETKCSRFQAWRMLFMVQRLVWRSRRRAYADYKMSFLQIRFGPYRTFDTVIEHNEASADGSAHRAIEDALLYLRRGEFAIRHEAIRFCAFRLLTNKVH